MRLITFLLLFLLFSCNSESNELNTCECEDIEGVRWYVNSQPSESFSYEDFKLSNGTIELWRRKIVDGVDTDAKYFSNYGSYELVSSFSSECGIRVYDITPDEDFLNVEGSASDSFEVLVQDCDNMSVKASLTVNFTNERP